MKVKPLLMLAGAISVSGFAFFNSIASIPETAKSDKTAPKFIAHEWGTFTTMSGTDGAMLHGLYRDEEQLPRYVYALGGYHGNPAPAIIRDKNGVARPVMMKGIWNRHLANVSVKMETPVIYFYSDEEKAFPLDVSVGFDGGSISQWYPQRSGGETLPPIEYKGKEVLNKTVDFAKRRKGSIDWQVDVLPASDSADFAVVKTGDTVNWIRPRMPRSNVLRNRIKPAEQEKYLFYRGLGNFDVPVNFSFADPETIKMESSMPSPFVLIYENSAKGARIVWQGKLDPGTEIKVPYDPNKGFQPLHNLQEELLATMQKGLIDEGLTSDEASVMLRTWWDSYFAKRGLRVFWVVPRSMTDQVLPLKFSSEPQELERVLVGRTELLTPELEERILKEFTKTDQKKNSFRGDRYFEAYQERAQALLLKNPKELAKAWAMKSVSHGIW